MIGVAPLTFVAFGFRGFCGFGFRGFCGFWLSWLTWLIHLYICLYLSVYYYLSVCLSVYRSIYLSIYLSIVLSFFLFRSCSTFSFCFCFSFYSLCKEETKQGSRQASKHELITFGSGVLLGGALRPPHPPRHEICTSSPPPAPATKSFSLLFC